MRPRPAALAAAILAPLAAIAPLAVGDAEGTLWDLLIYADVTGNVAYGGPMTVAGSVTDHAGWPVAGAAVTVRAGSEAMEATSAADGTFEV
ncbi:MAG: carboxypeptidase regulatory-like domain-containing protein [Thaumarchaeota archaeon S14]|nr:MAG: carboxypeptidase regulatory-like domain-containing protein [Thaumarchaeota archaeon S14]